MAEAAPVIMLDSASVNEFGHSWRFQGHVETVQAFAHDEVLPALAKVEKSAAAGYHAVGFIAYEAAAGLNPDLPPLIAREGLPLLWFAIYRQRLALDPAETFTAETASPPVLSRSSPRRAILKLSGG